MLLTQDERKKFAVLVNAVVDIPLVPENLEQVIFEHALASIDVALEETLPPPFQEFMRDPSKGIDKDQAREFAERLMDAINKRIDLPYLTEEQEGQLFRMVINPLVKAMTDGKQLSDLLPILKELSEE
ncbi:MAG: hypothetical protein KDJ65_00755 [Anaerolineae bacterium]|nr:hypothetical protein [Anaerolineae bacterium]